MHVIDEVMADAWPPAEVELLGRSRLRSTWGLTRRANSVLAASDLDDADVIRVEAFYAARQAPARFQLSDASARPGLAERLAGRGYERSGDTTTFWQRIAAPGVVDPPSEPASDPTARPDGEGVALDDTPSPEWFTVYWPGEHRGPLGPEVAERYTTTLLAAAPPRTFASVRRDGEVVAVGQGVVRSGWLSVQCMATVAAHRRTGAATAVLDALRRWGAGHGADRAALAVLDGNEPARRLYERAGFHPSHGYAYWTREAA